MHKFLLVLTLAIASSSYASGLTAIQIQMVQNRVIKIANTELLMLSVCDALMDMQTQARCQGVTTWGAINYHKNINPNYKKMLDETTYQFIAVSMNMCGRQSCQEVATMNLTKLDDMRYKINIKVVQGSQPNFDADVYKKYFDAIGNSLFLNKAGVELGSLSE